MTTTQTQQMLPLTPRQATFVASPEGFQHLVGTPGSGRTYACCAKAVQYALTHTNAHVLYALPVADWLFAAQDLLERAAGSYVLTSMVPALRGWGGGEMHLHNGSIVILRTLGDPAFIRAAVFDAICIDDYDHCHPDLVRIAQGRLRSRRHAPQMWITRRLRPTDRPEFATVTLATTSQPAQQTQPHAQP